MADKSVAGAVFTHPCGQSIYGDADRFDITRRHNPHLSFGQGPHLPGAALARLELRCAFPALFVLLDDLALAIAAEDVVYRGKARSALQPVHRRDPVQLDVLSSSAKPAPTRMRCMTGGMPRAEAINRHLSEAAQALGIAMCVSSQRVSLQSRNSRGATRARRRLARDIPLLANIGVAQLREADGLDLARRAVDAAGGRWTHRPSQSASGSGTAGGRPPDTFVGRRTQEPLPRRRVSMGNRGKKLDTHAMRTRARLRQLVAEAKLAKQTNAAENTGVRRARGPTTRGSVGHKLHFLRAEIRG
ncbi:hypothetical protein ACVIYL_008826 [Bradyrhizobium sp. USDA 3315]